MAIEFLSKKEPKEKIVDILDHEPEKIYDSLTEMLKANISEAGAKVEIRRVEFSEMDNAKLAHGAAYFKVKLSSSKNELQKIAGEDLLFNYDWEEGVEGINTKAESEKPMVIKPTFSAPLEEFNFLIERGESVQEAIKANKSEAERWAQKLVEAEIKNAKAKVKVESVYFLSNDDEEENEEGGFSYYDLRISGSENELRKIAGKNKDLHYDWKDKEDGNGTKKNNSSTLEGKSKADKKKKIQKKKDWTEPEWLDQADWRNLKIIKKYFDQGNFKEAMSHAMDCDTVIREEIPGDIWKKMGGELTKTGEEKLKAASSYYGNTPDDNNPKFIFQTTSTNLLVLILDGGIDINYCVKAELANRGVDKHGDWVGFDAATRIHKIKK